MDFSIFMKIMKRHFAPLFIPETKHVISAKDFLQNMLNAFINSDLEDNDFIPLNLSNDHLAKILNGSEPLSTNQASKLLLYIDEFTFEEFYDSSNISTESEQTLIQEFKEYGINISINNISEAITNTLITILKNIVNKDIRPSIKEASISNGIIKYNKAELTSKISKNDKIKDYSKQIFIKTLLNVYNLSTSTNITSLIKLENLDPQFFKYLQFQIQCYEKAITLFHKLKATFCDGEFEFNELKSEVLNYLNLQLLYRFEPSVESITSIIKNISTSNFFKSYLSKPGNGFVGIKEIIGIIHILINEEKISWTD